jgi:hypothetical protein
MQGQFWAGRKATAGSQKRARNTQAPFYRGLRMGLISAVTSIAEGGTVAKAARAWRDACHAIADPIPPRRSVAPSAIFHAP